MEGTQTCISYAAMPSQNVKTSLQSSNELTCRDHRQNEFEKLIASLAARMYPYWTKERPDCRSLGARGGFPRAFTEVPNLDKTARREKKKIRMSPWLMIKFY